MPARGATTTADVPRNTHREAASRRPSGGAGLVAAYGLLALPLAFAALPIYVHVPRLYSEAVGLSLVAIGAILLAAAGQLDHPAIAVALGVSVNNLNVILHRARQALRERFRLLSP